MESKPRMKNRIIICTAKFSDNLGDGVISECVDYLIGRSSSAYPVVHLDISGRTEYLDSNKKNSSVFKRIYHLSPKAVRPLLTIAGWLVIFRKRLKLRLAEIKFRPGDALIFGGGQVVSDISLNFPLKLSFIYKAATKKGVKVSFNAVGVGGAFSFLGKKLVQPIFDSNLTTFTSVRDPLSKKHLEDLTNGSI
ncbi:MAG: polysaccharide pyruvyl transferase WcaK-like protein, partial [Oleispira sp.]